MAKFPKNGVRILFKLSSQLKLTLDSQTIAVQFFKLLKDQTNAGVISTYVQLLQ